MGEGFSADDCSKKWKSLRDRYVREVKKVKARKSDDGTDTTYVPKWRLYHILSFVGDTVRQEEIFVLGQSQTFLPATHHTGVTMSVMLLRRQKRIQTLKTGKLDMLVICVLFFIDLFLYSLLESEYGTSLPVSPVPTSAGSSSSPVASTSSSQQPPAKRRKVNKADDVDTFLMKTMKDIQEWRNNAEVADSEAHFGNHVAAMLRSLQPRQRAVATLQIDQIILNAEFP